MAKIGKIHEEIIRKVLKNIAVENTITSLAGEIKATRMGIWKALKKLESESQIILEPIGKGKTSTYKIKLNWQNPLVEKTLVAILLKDALEQERWRYNFKKLENHVLFIMLFGSILHSPKEANDIDLLVITKNGKEFKVIKNIISEAQISQSKKIHAIDLTIEELKENINNKNKAYLEAINKGVVLFGQEDFIKFIQNMKK